MEASATAPRSRSPISGRSPLFCSCGQVGSPKSCDKARPGGCPGPLLEHDAGSLGMGLQAGPGKRVPGSVATPPCPRSAIPSGSFSLPLNQAVGLSKGALSAQTPHPKEVLRLAAQGREVTSVSPRGSWEELGYLSEKEEEEVEEESIGRASGDLGASDRAHFAQALKMEHEGPQRAMELLAASTVAFTREHGEEEEEAKEEEEEKECLLKGEYGDLRGTSSQAGGTPWSHILSLYKHLRKSAMTQFSFQEDLANEEKREEVEEEEDSLAKLCDTHLATSQSPPRRTFMYTETLGFVESELKKLLAVPQEPPFWKVDSPEGQELPAQPEVTVKEADMVQSLGVESGKGWSPELQECAPLHEGS
ncbi:gametogenetin-binding protein 1-like [Perognathus longimembris pacificus]|uniref:gametogenetin-binding protein 1-like n=1 Tax=Perognathus longimembris pacificus TaxID=214514 RepID=UPI0020199215|nr:gametogenetin-binding protein 1-like [Perognathus longimembris pacificus]